jgi:hypothetical protein
VHLNRLSFPSSPKNSRANAKTWRYAVQSSPNVRHVAGKAHRRASIRVIRRNTVGLIAPHLRVAADDLLDRHPLSQEFENTHITNLRAPPAWIMARLDLLTVNGILRSALHEERERPHASMAHDL